MHVLHEVEIKFINHGYSLWFGLVGIMKCRKNIEIVVLKEKGKCG